MRKRIFAQVGPLVAPVIEGIAGEEIAKHTGHAIDWAQEKFQHTKQQSGETDDKDLVINSEYAFNELANQIRSMGVTDPKFTNPENLFSFFKDSYSFNAKKDLVDILSAITSFLQAASAGGLNKLDPDIINDIFKFAFDFYKRSNYDKQATIGKINDLSEKAVDPFFDAYVVAILKNNYTLASAITLLSNLGKMDQRTLQEMMNVSSLANKMLGNQSVELLDAQALIDEKNRTTFEFLQQSKQQYRLLAPMAMEKEKFVQNLYKQLESSYGSALAKNLVSDPIIMNEYIWSAGLSQGVKNVAAGAAEAVKGR